MDGKEYADLQYGDSVSITFSSVLNNMASGTFKATLTNPFNTSERIYITEGFFKNIKIVDTY